ncbi:MAG: TrmJ/YjtD family RNA methyltransferase [Elusimicrobiota bacterium]|jgi:tRNA/rRNA methyltransferase|nr:TrmJ/YjtD family RNA methyltransferase [Elusimicrobiota bacterium]
MPNISIILVKPRNPQNIGAVARAMGNFGLEDLRIVCPFAPVWEEAASAVGAEYIIKTAKIYDNLQAALHDANFILAATALKSRKINRKIISLPQIENCLIKNANSNIAIIFGPEKTGLTTGEISLANAVLNIPTASKVPSINLAQAVILCCYEITKNKIPPRKSQPAEAASFEEKDILIKNVEILLKELDLPPTLNRRICQSRLRGILAESPANKQNIFFINSLIGKITRKISKNG